MQGGIRGASRVDGGWRIRYNTLSQHDTWRHTMGFSGYFALLVIIAALLGDFD